MRSLKTLTYLILATWLIFALSAWAQQKPLTQAQVQSLVRDGLGDETGAKAIEKRGIDFAPAEDFMRGRQTESKALIVVAAEEDGKGIGRIRMRRISDTSAHSLISFVQESVEPGSVAAEPTSYKAIIRYAPADWP
jgi:hypothetical protein